MVTSLRCGLLVQEEAVSLALDLEVRAHVLTAHGGDLFVSQPAALTDGDRSEIRRYKFHLLAIAAYEFGGSR